MEFSFLLAVIILVLSLVQSLFGIGLLAIGTPTLMLLDFSFFDTLSIILPCSITISICQIYDAKIKHYKFMSNFLVYCIPFLVFSLLFFISLNEQINIKIFIALMLFLSGLLRLGLGNYRIIDNFLVKNSIIAQAIIGTIHGFTNMGGALLALYSSSKFAGEKNATRFGIAFGYAVMGILQYFIVLLSFPNLFKSYVLFYMMISLGCYIILGRSLFRSLENKSYGNYLSFIIIFYSLIILLDELNV